MRKPKQTNKVDWERQHEGIHWVMRRRVTGECYFRLTREALLELVTPKWRPNDMEALSKQRE
jgi:hypothetical protein